MSPLPPIGYACAIIVDTADRLWLELRPADTRDAPGKLTCFGGTVEADETPEACLVRELEEELGFQLKAAAPKVSVELTVGTRVRANFYAIQAPPLARPIRLLAGRGLVLVSAREFERFPIADWNLAALRAWRDGESTARVD